MVALPSNKIRITQVPDGEAPWSIREMWLGVEMEFKGEDSDGISQGVLTGKIETPETSRNAGGYLVTIFEAVFALHQAGKHGTALWWQDNCGHIDYLVFGKDFCEVLE